MARDRVLCASAERLTAWVRSGRAIGIEAEFAADEQGCTGLAAYLGQHSDCDFTVLVDFADEEFELQEIPAVRGRNRRALVARRLEQIHFGSPLRMAVACGRRRDGRRDERVLFAALPQAPALTRWLEVLERADAAVASVASMAQLAERLSPLPAQALPHRLVVTTTRTGLRQTFIENGRLRLSRLTPAVAEAELPSLCAAEAERLRQYLAGRVLADDALLPVTVLAEARQLEHFRAECADTDRLRFECIDLDDELTRAGTTALPPAAGAEALLVHLSMRQRPAEQFASPSMRRSFLLRRAERVLHRAAATALAVGLLTGGLQWAEARRMEDASGALSTLVAADTRRYEQRLLTLPPLPVPAQRLHATLDAYDNLLRRSPQPTATYRLLGDALVAFPQVFVERLDWKLDDGDRVELELNGSLPPSLAGDPRGQLGVVEGLKHRLEATPSVGVRILTTPFDTDPAKPLAGNAAAAQRPKFSLRVVLPAS